MCVGGGGVMNVDQASGTPPFELRNKTRNVVLGWGIIFVPVCCCCVDFLLKFLCVPGGGGWTGHTATDPQSIWQGFCRNSLSLRLGCPDVAGVR